MLPVLLDLKDHVKSSCAFIKLKPKDFNKLSGLIFSFSKIAINEKGEINAIPVMTIMNMISPFDRPQLHSDNFYQRNLQSQCTVYLPVQLTPFQKYPGSLQIHRKDPLVLWHLELLSQLWFSVAHSLMSEKQEVLLFSLSFFYYIVFTTTKGLLRNSFLYDSDDYRRNWF